MDKASNGVSKTLPLANLTEAELKNVLEQRRLVSDAAKVHRMLAFALDFTMSEIAKKYELPKVFEFDAGSGVIYEKEPPNG